MLCFQWETNFKKLLQVTLLGDGLVASTLVYWNNHQVSRLHLTCARDYCQNKLNFLDMQGFLHL
ncbi:hypothetical protein NC652_003294 [Populus alba x Populus x berolinensis]|nr:hypothetical protein NC652_003294 [Populus alba x Populus x berolinensis]